MPGTVLAIDSNFEDLTQAASIYREQHVYPYLESKGYHVNLLQGSQVDYDSVKEAASDPPVVLVTGVSHGTPDAFTGYFGVPVLKVGEYAPAEVNGKIIHFLSCGTAKILGRDVVYTGGCRAFFGYDQPFFLDLDDSANFFFECDGEIDRALADGLNAADAVARAKALFNQRIQELAGNPSAARLEFDCAHLKSPSDDRQWGDPTAKLP